MTKRQDDKKASNRARQQKFREKMKRLGYTRLSAWVRKEHVEMLYEVIFDLNKSEKEWDLHFVNPEHSERVGAYIGKLERREDQ